jgi:hypothetical protein
LPICESLHSIVLFPFESIFLVGLLLASLV